MKKYFLIIMSALLAGMVWSGCQTDGSYISDKNLQKMLLGTWKLIPIVWDDTIPEKWTFSDGGALKIDKTASLTGKDSTWYNLTYSSGGGITKSYVTIAGFPANKDIYNGKWQVVHITNSVLVIINAQTSGGKSAGESEREFTKE